jgi:hypothetical protein
MLHDVDPTQETNAAAQLRLQVGCPLGGRRQGVEGSGDEGLDDRRRPTVVDVA